MTYQLGSSDRILSSRLLCAARILRSCPSLPPLQRKGIAEGSGRSKTHSYSSSDTDAYLQIFTIAPTQDSWT